MRTSIVSRMMLEGRESRTPVICIWIEVRVSSPARGERKRGGGERVACDVGACAIRWQVEMCSSGGFNAGWFVSCLGILPVSRGIAGREGQVCERFLGGGLRGRLGGGRVAIEEARPTMHACMRMRVEA